MPSGEVYCSLARAFPTEDTCALLSIATPETEHNVANLLRVAVGPRHKPDRVFVVSCCRVRWPVRAAHVESRVTTSADAQPKALLTASVGARLDGADPASHLQRDDQPGDPALDVGVDVEGGHIADVLGAVEGNTIVELAGRALDFRLLAQEGYTPDVEALSKLLDAAAETGVIIEPSGGRPPIAEQLEELRLACRRALHCVLPHRERGALTLSPQHPRTQTLAHSPALWHQWNW